MALQHLLNFSVQRRGAHPAIIEGNDGESVNYARLGWLSDRLRDRLAALGVTRGDRVGIYLRKSVDSVASVFGVLKAGAAYVPVDPTAPASRNAYIHNHCGVKVVIVEQRFEAAYRSELTKLGPLPWQIVLDTIGGGRSLEAALDTLDVQASAPPVPTVDSAPDDLAYILYTSGSTGKPKGVMLSHRNTLALVDWCSETFAPRASDIFAAHAPFHFALAVFHLYVPLKHGARLILIPEDMGKEPGRLAKLMSDYHISFWYSAPSILSLLAQCGKLAEHDYSSLRMILFAGEVFPLVHLHALKRQIPHSRYFNLYGCTETNLCTWYEIPAMIPDERTTPYPIGKSCSHLASIVVDSDGKPVLRGAEGELCIAGPSVTPGYWALPEQTAQSFLLQEGSDRRWFRTGSIVTEEPDGAYRCISRRDRMVKKRGYRVELGEIEACLSRHTAVRQAAVIALPDEASGVKVIAHLSIREDERPSLIELKTFCSQHLPVYMVPDVCVFHASLPATSTDKIDYQALQNLR